MYSSAVSKITIDGVEVVGVALSEALDGSISEDYHQRVEPSIQGGRKMAELILVKLCGHTVVCHLGAGAGAGLGSGLGKQTALWLRLQSQLQ